MVWVETCFKTRVIDTTVLLFREESIAAVYDASNDCLNHNVVISNRNIWVCKECDNIVWQTNKQTNNTAIS